MPPKQTLEEKKSDFNNQWSGKLDDRLVDYTLKRTEKQQLICLTKDEMHLTSKLFDEKIGYVVFQVTWNNLNNYSSGCPVCAEVQRRISKRTDEKEIIERIHNHRNNIPGPTGNKTVMKSEYKGRAYKHMFSCGMCGKEFERTIDDILRDDRKPYCFKCSSRSFSGKSIRWLESLNIKNLMYVGVGKEYTIPGTRYKVDGYDVDTKTAYEFHGCIYHGHCIINPNCPLTKNKGSLSCYDDTFIDLYDRTESRKKDIEKMGHKCVEIWECEFDLIESQRPDTNVKLVLDML